MGHKGLRLAACLLVALLAGACTGNATPRTRAPATPSLTTGWTPASVAATTPVESRPASPGPSVASKTLPPPDAADPTPIAADGLPAPALRDLVVGDRPFDLTALRGHPVLLFFGYTNCPDVCPMTVGELVMVLEDRPDVRAVFVTVDPERDTPESLAEWTRYMAPGFLALTGSPAAIRTAADAYGVRYARVDSGSAAGYSMSHTAFVYLIDSEGRHRLTFPFGTGWATMARAIDGLPGTVEEDAS